MMGTVAFFCAVAIGGAVYFIKRKSARRRRKLGGSKGAYEKVPTDDPVSADRAATEEKWDWDEDDAAEWVKRHPPACSYAMAF
eukprot:SAG31_NODE_6512_length_1991_cov_1.468816_3_plen_83_part_00